MPTPVSVREASDYFNSLPIEQRQRLAPLLEDYRRLGIEEAHLRIRQVGAQLKRRMLSIDASQKAEGI